MLTAIIRNQTNSGWEIYRSPLHVLIAANPTEVKPALAQLDLYCDSGYTAIGFLAYHAASAFDASLTCIESKQPLLLFGVYDAGEAFQMPEARAVNTALAPEVGKSDWQKGFDKIKRYLLDGESYQVNFTQRLSGFFDDDPLALFASLYQLQPSSLAAFLQWGEHSVCSVSPELFFALDGDSIVMKPMKGTRPRSSQPQLDEFLREQLIGSEKERAENLMIVDMIRNDLSRIARPGTIDASELFTIVRLPTVWQQISTIRASTNASLEQLFQALFPCASITGAPKASTMRIISELETSPRGIYTGSIGVIRPQRQMRFSVAIRTLIHNKSERYCEYGVGCGIVWDSDPNQEWQELLVKSRILFANQDPLELLETMRYDSDRGILRLDQHLNRLDRAAAFFGFDLNREAIVRELGAFSAHGDSRLRLLIDADGCVRLSHAPVPVTKSRIRLKLANQAVSSRDNFLYFKTTRRLVYERNKLTDEDCDDTILFNERGELTETTIYNLYLEIGGELLTPAAHCGLLPGVYRQTLLESGQAREAVLKKSDLLRARRVFVSNSVRELCEAEFIRR